MLLTRISLSRHKVTNVPLRYKNGLKFINFNWLPN